MDHYLEDFLDHNYERFLSTMRQLSIKKRKSIVDKTFEQSTCLSIACENRDYEMIDFLLANCKADSNIPCLFNLKNRTTCTPLMFACAKNLILMVKLLIEYGNADVNKIDSNGENCLFYAVRGSEQCQELVEYLIDKNVDWKKLNNQGYSVLNYSLNHQSSKMTLLLLDLNCPIVNPVSLDSPLLICALNGDVEKYNMLYCEKDIPKELKILGSEILGAVLCENRELVEYSVFYWQISLQERYSINLTIEQMNKMLNRHLTFKSGNIEKTNLRQLDDFLPEFANENDLNRIGKDTIDLCMQSLWIRERVLLKFKTPSKLSSINIYQSLHTTCAEINTEFANPHSYLIMNQQRLETLWLYSLGIQLKFSQPRDDTLVPNLIDYVLYLTYANSNMKSTFQVVNAFKVAKMCLYQIGRHYPSLRLLNGLTFDDLFELNDPELRSIDIDNKTDGCENGELYFILKVFILALRMLTIEENYSQLNDVYRQELKTLTKRFIYIDRKLNNRYSLLDVSLKVYNITWFGNHDRYVDIKCPVTQEAVSYLLECGADPNSCQIYSEKGRNTCFNKSLFRLDDQQLCERLILVFLKYGAHFDYSNDKILAPVDNYKLKYGRSIPVDVVNPVKHTSLKCLCTKVIRREQLDYWSQLPKELVEFVNLH